MLPKFLTKRKIIPIILVLALLFPLFAQPIRAFYSGSNNSYPINFYHAVFKTKEMNLQSFVYETMRATIMSIVTLIVGDHEKYEEDEYFERIKKEYEKYFENPQEESQSINLQNNDALFQLAQFTSLIYANPPASGVEYLADVGRRLNLVQPAYAQEGVGWKRFQYALPIWKAFRNVTYVFFVLILVFMGFAIMFRVKISPQTVITIQSALPKIIIALILITFSYAIVGFLIDLMYVIINLTIFFFSNIEFGFPSGLGWLETFMKWLLPKQPTTNDFSLFFTMLTVGIGPLTFILLVIIILGVLGIIGLVGTAGISAPITAISLLIALILVVLLLLALLRVCWALLKAYINVLIALIFAPFQLLIGTLPGSNAIGSWFKNLIANLAVWPAVFIMTFLSGFITLSGLAEVTRTGITGNLIILPIVGLGILLMTPKVSDMIKAFLAGKSFEYGTAIGETMGPVMTVGKLGVRAAPPVFAEKYLYGEEATTMRRQLARLGEMAGLWKKPETQA